MSRHEDPLTCCDWDCARANDCQVGGLQCEDCGCWFCAYEIDENGLCDDCAKARRRKQEEEEFEQEDE